MIQVWEGVMLRRTPEEPGEEGLGGNCKGCYFLQKMTAPSGIVIDTCKRPFGIHRLSCVEEIETYNPEWDPEDEDSYEYDYVDKCYRWVRWGMNENTRVL